MAGDPADRGDRRFPLLDMLPRPVPYRYRFLDAEERAGRGRLAVRLWLLGFSPATAWAFAMSEGSGWREQLPDRYAGHLVDALLEGAVIRRRLWDVVLASDLYHEVVGDLQREAPGPGRL
jgi:hypothetical protein